ncbi:MAG: rRNA pseudouridine synthase [Turicibacter sp.]|nr:rRNA pseudouridine synthase [Turicibacter sp.]
MDRLQKYLAYSGITSRRKAEGLITAGRVTVNGTVVDKLGTRIDPDTDIVTVDGKIVQSQPKQLYIALHKPISVVSSVTDPRNRPVVMDFVKDISARIFPVGRLDYDTSGLILLTNDGRLTQALTHPKHVIPKKYIADLKGVPNYRALAAFRSGLKIDDGIKTAPAKIEITRKKHDSCKVCITIFEGRNRQIRKMCDAIGHPVTKLKRISIGKISLNDLPVGKHRHLTAKELSATYSLFENEGK